MRKFPEDGAMDDIDAEDIEGIEERSGDDQPSIVVIPLEVPTVETDLRRLIRSSSDSKGELDEDEETLTTEDMVKRSTIHIHSIAETPEATLENILASSELEASPSLTRLAQCAAFWRSVGVDTLIYFLSYGASLTANGLIIRFGGASVLASTLALGGVGAINFGNANLLVNSLLKPAVNKIPKARKAQFEAINRYAVLPFSWVCAGGVSGTILAIMGDTDVGTQQYISAVSGPTSGPFMNLARSGIRACLGGSIVLAPDTPGVVSSFRTAYGTRPNPLDADRPYLWGTVRGMFGRIMGVTAGTLACYYSNGFQIQTYCGPEGRRELEAILANNGTITGEDVEEYCFAGNFTFAFRQLGLSTGYALGLLIVEPVFNYTFNKIFDWFYPADNGPDETTHLVPDALIEEIEDD